MKHPLFILLWWIKTSWTEEEEEEEEEEENPAGSVYLELITNMGEWRDGRRQRGTDIHY